MKNYIFESSMNPDIAFVLAFNDKDAEQGSRLALEGFRAWTFGEATEHYTEEEAKSIYDCYGYEEASKELLDKANISYTELEWLDEDGDILPEYENESYTVLNP